MKKKFFLLIALFLLAGAVHAQQAERTDITLVRDYMQSPASDGVQDSIAPFSVILGADVIYIGHEDPNYYWDRTNSPQPLPSDAITIVITKENNDTIFKKEYATSSVRLFLNYLGIPNGSYTLHFFWREIWWKGDFVFESHWPEGIPVYIDSTYYRLNGRYATTVWPDYYIQNERTVSHRMYWDAFERDYPLHVVIPSELIYEENTYQVVGIEHRSFKHCYYLLSVELPNTITHIDGGAFLACTNLRRINIPESVTTIEGSAFDECENLSYIEIPEGITAINDKTFRHCFALSAVTLPSSLTYIGLMAFAGCTSLPWIDIPNNVTSIGDYAFQGCKNLMEVELPKKLRRIGNCAFRGDQSLTSIVIPDGVTYIGTEAFMECLGLSSVTLPGSITQIGDKAFNISSSAHIYCNAKEPFTICDRTFNFKCTLHVPYGCKEKYEKADIWKKFTHIAEMDEEHNDPEVMYGETGVSPVVRSEDAESPAFDLSGKPVDASHKGIVIRNGKKILVK